MEQKSFILDFMGEPVQIWYIKDPAFAARALEELSSKSNLFGLDFETVALPGHKEDPESPLDPHRARPRLMSVAYGKNALVFDLFHIPHEVFRNFLLTHSFIAHNALFELKFCIKHFDVDICIGCTFLAAKLLQHAIYPDDSRLRASLDAVAKSILKVDLFKDISHAHWGNPDLNQEQIEYAALDSIVVMRLLEPLSRGLKRYGLVDTYNLYRDTQYPLARMMLRGMKVDYDKHLTELIPAWNLKAYAAKKELLEMTGLPSAITAHTIAEWLENNLPADTLAFWPRTESEKLSTSADTFSDFSYLDIVRPFSEYQKATTLSSTFGYNLLNRVLLPSKRLHTNFKLCGTRTGRLSSSKPNMQNMPRSEEMRSIFIAEPGNVLVVADFNQIELRVAAELSGDKEMRNAYRAEIDLHSLTAARTSGKRISDITPEDRQCAKALNFGLLYGLGKKKFRHYAKKSYGAELTEMEAFEAVTAWHELYDGYSAWQKEQASTCEHTLHTKTVTGKLRKLSVENYYGASANTPIQGTAAECVNHALILLDEHLPNGAFLVNTVHDEIVVECRDGPQMIADVEEALICYMTEGYKRIFPQGLTKGLVKADHGPNWAAAK